MAGINYLRLVLCFDAAVYVVHTWLDTRQLKALRRPGPPPELAHLYATPEDYRSKQAYSIDSLRFGMARGAFESALSAALLLSGFLPWSWEATGRAVGTDRPIMHSVVWAMTTMSVSAAAGFPWSVAHTFGLEARHGFNKTTPKTFITDTLKGLALAVTVGPPIIAGISWILSVAGPWVGLYLWGFMLAIGLFFMAIYPSVIAPLFNTFTPLPEGGLREEIEALAASLKFPLTKLFVVDGSKRSAHSNAYMYGFWKSKRIVLYDTLIGQVQVLGQLLLFTALRASPALSSSFGFGHDGAPPFVAFALFQYISGPLDEALGCLNNWVTRRFEFQADAFGVAKGRGADLKAALLVLDKENKSAPHTDFLYSAYHYSHPPLLERLRAIDAAMAAEEKDSKKEQ